MKIKISAQHFLDVTNAMDKVKPFGYVGGQNFLVPFSEVKPIEGYEIPINEKTGKALPFCCNYHRKLYYEIDKWYKNKFPNCCENHKILASNPHFKKIDYKNVAIKVVQQLSYTEHIIRKNIDNIDWYDDITEYIYYNSFSFGHPVSVGNNYYLENLLGMLEDVNFFKSIDERKKDALIKFVKSFYEPIEKVENTDLNLLYSTYQNWLDIFPFELSFFGNLKAHFQNQFPILIGKPQTNRYLGTAKFNVHSKESLIISLLSITDSIITQLNSNNLLENNLLTEPDKIKFEIIVSERKLKTKIGYLSNENDDKRKFADILNEWFADEKKFIDEVTPLLKALPPQPLKVGNNNLKPKITINSEAKESIFSILKDFFEAEQQDELKEVLTTFGIAKNKLIFKSNGNQFTDTFKRLFENNLILGCQKTDLINWIVSNFNFMYRNEVKEFKTKTVEQIISGNQTHCKSPIIEIKNGQIFKKDY